MAANVNFEEKTNWVQDEIVYPADVNRWEKGIKDCVDLVNDHNARIPEIEAGKVNKSGDTMTGALKVPTADLSAADNTVINCEWAEKKEQSRIANCLTKIPQDINLTLENGELKLTNSYIYVPNGPDIFEKVNVTTSRNWTVEANKTFLLYLNTKSVLTVSPVEKAFSGDTAPEGATYAFWYDTANNKIKYVANDGVWQELQTCLPVAVVSSDGTGKIARIDQVFNGFGYIGKTLFVLPGVEGLVPNGRNADGSLNNTKIAVSKVLLKNNITNNYGYITLSSNAISSPPVSTYSYNSNNNLNYFLGNRTYDAIVGVYISDANGKITSFNPKTAFHAVDYNEADFVIASYSDSSGNWYRKWSSGWLEQGGNAATRKQITFLKPYATGANSLTIIGCGHDGYDQVLSFYSITETSFNSIGRNTGGSDLSFSFYWYACGQGA